MNFLQPQPLVAPRNQRRLLRVVSALSLLTLTLQMTGMGFVLRPSVVQAIDAAPIVEGVAKSIATGSEQPALVTETLPAEKAQVTEDSTLCGSAASSQTTDGIACDPPVLTACPLYGYNDVGTSDSQFFSMNLQTGISTAIGSVATDEDIEALDAHPVTGIIYGFPQNGSDDSSAVLVTINRATGARTVIANVSSDFELPGASFNPATNELWAGADTNDNLYTVNLATGATTLKLDASKTGEPQALAWNNAGTVLYVAYNNKIFTTNGTSALAEVADVGSEVEAMEFDELGNLLVAKHGNASLYVLVGSHLVDTTKNLIGNDVETFTTSCPPTPQPGSLKVTKIIDGSADVNLPHQFGFRLGSSGSYVYPVLGQNSVTFDQLTPGTFNVSESSPAGYHQVSTTCTNVTVVAGQQATCTIHNTPDTGTLKVIKHVVGDVAVASDWKIHVKHDGIDVANSPQNGSETGTIYTLAPGAYAVSESDGPAGYTLTIAYDCGSNGTVAVTAGHEVICTLTNTKNAPEPATLTVIKHVVNDSGGTKVASDFTMQVTGTNVSTPSFPGNEQGTSVTLDAGSYSVNEVSVTGYTKNLSSGCSGTIAAGQHTTCTVTNNDQAASLTVIKHVVNDNGGTKVADDFTMQVTGTNVSNASFPGNESGTTLTLNAGSYGVDEAAVTGYAKTLGTNCSGSVDLGEHKTCTVTNDDIAPRLRLIKHVVNDNGGTKQVADFPLFINGNQVTSGAWNAVHTGVLYTATETTDAGYAATTWIGDCTANGAVTLSLGQDKTCEITNNDISPQLIVYKLVDNANGGTAAPGDFTLRATGQNPNPESFHGSSQGTTVTLNAGIYAVTEDAYVGYTPAYSSDCSGTIGVGQVKHCTVTNASQATHLIVVKHVMNDNGGTKNASNFSLTINGIVVSGSATFSGAENPGVMKTVEPGTYNITEVEQNGYAASYSAGCNGTIARGETKYCTVTNNDIAPRLTVTKVVVNDNGGTKQVTDFPLFVDGTSVTSGVQNQFGAGTYTVHETNLPGYAGSITGDCATNGTMTLYPGDVKSCTVTNNDIAPQLTVIKHVINNEGGTKNASNFSMVVAGTNVSSASFPGNESGTLVTLDAGSYAVDELADGQYTKSFSDNCSGTLAIGENRICTITNNDKGVTISGFKRNTQEQPLDGWTICLTPAVNMMSFRSNQEMNKMELLASEPNCVVTGAGSWPDGYYEFTNLSAGSYEVAEIIQPHWQAVSPVSGAYSPVTVSCGDMVQRDFTNRQVFADLTVTKTDGLTTANPGQQTTYTIVVINNGEDAALNSAAIDTLPPQATYVSSKIDGVDATPLVTLHDTGDVIAWNLETMDSGSSKTITVVVHLDALFPFGTTTLTNSVHVSTTTAESNTENNDATDVTTVAAAPTINIDKSGPEAVTSGNNITYTLAWSVGGNALATNALVSDVLPANTTFVSATCGTTTGACVMDTATTTITWNLGTRSPGESGTVILTVRTASPLANGTVITNTGVFDTTENTPVTDTVTTRITSSSQLTLTKKDNVDPVAPGGTVVYTIAWSVIGNAPLTNLVLTDTLPVQLTFVAASNSGTHNGVNPGGIVTWNLGNHVPGDAGSVTLTTTTGTSLTNGTVITNPVALKAAEVDPVGTTETTTIVAAPKLGITKTVDLPFANPGDIATYTVTITNTGNDAAVNLMLTDTLPAGLTFVDSGTATKTFALGTLAKGASTTVIYKILVSTSQTAGFYDNSAVAKADNHGPVTALARLEVRIPTVKPAEETPALSLQKSVDKTVVNPNETLTYTINIANDGNATALDVRLTDTLPTGFVFTDTKSGKRIWMIGTLLAGEARTIAYTVTVGSTVKSGTYPNLVVATAKNQPSLKASVPVEVRVPKVLGTELPKTGAITLDLMFFLLGLAALTLGTIGLVRSRRLPIEKSDL